MAPFNKLDWSRIDVWAIVVNREIAVVDWSQRDKCIDWLVHNQYEISSIDFSGGISPAVQSLSTILHWKENFGYELQDGEPNLDALRDGFEFEIPEVGGFVLELKNPHLGWMQNPRWLLGLLAIAQETSITELAVGKRFFCLLTLPETCQLVGQVIESVTVPAAFWTAGTKKCAFEN